MWALIIGVLFGIVLAQIGAYFAKLLSRSRAKVLYKKGWDAALSAHERDVEPVSEGLYDEHHPNPLHIPIGGRISFYFPFREPQAYEKQDASTFRSMSGTETITINDLAEAEAAGGVWRLVE